MDIREPNSEKSQLNLTTLSPSPKSSAFLELGFKQTIAHLEEEIRTLYTMDEVPWIIGYSGGKDSTATLQLVWNAITGLPESSRKKTIHVISTDTLVENPVVAAWVHNSMRGIEEKARQERMPFIAKLLHPEVEETFWVALIGKGYPAPRPKFRWCTERLKISPSNRYISQVVNENNEAILCLGARKQESAARAKVLSKNAKYRVIKNLSPSPMLPGCQIFTPVEDWSSDDIWFFLNTKKNPWGISNKELMGMYAGASPDGECPLVVDTSTPSCGDSRFGCWVCTLVEKDKSMSAMIQNDVEKDWLMPLLEIRNALDFRINGKKFGEYSDHHLRDFRRMSGAVQLLSHGKAVPGPYTQTARIDWLRKLLKAQTHIRKAGPESVSKLELITLPELQEIRRIWVIDKHEIEDRLPQIYEEATGERYPGIQIDDSVQLGEAEMEDLASICGSDRLHYELTRELLSLTRQHKDSGRRAGYYQKLEKTFTKHFYDDKNDALSVAGERRDAREKLQRSSLLPNEQSQPKDLSPQLTFLPEEHYDS